MTEIKDNKDVYILAIESSCDDTSAAVMRGDTVLSNVTAGQAVHEQYGGVVPELASRAHEQNIVPVVDAALKKAGILKEQLSAIAFTRGPGLMGSLLVGVSFAKGLAASLGIPMIEVNHLQGHIMAHFIKEEGVEKSVPEFPFLCLMVSGGNSQIVKVSSYKDMEIVGQTIDDAAGEAIDKCAKIMGIYISDNPALHYTIKGLQKKMIASNVKASEAEIVRKEKYFKDLTDEDIYTYVTLKDVEFPVRKGSICPINEGYSAAGNSDRISKFPLLVRDINGDSFYMYTNTVCMYRNDGTRVPQGSGKLSGVIVHERFSRFEWKNGMDLLDMEEDPQLGNIGRYQIRHQTKEDIYRDMNMDFKDSFSELLAEYRYWNPDTEAGVQRPTYGDNGWFTHTYQKKYTGTEAKEYKEEVYGQYMSAEVCFSYLGPIGVAKSIFGANKGNVNGLGILLDSDKDRYNPEMEEWVGNDNGVPEWLAPSTSKADAEVPLRVANDGGNAGKGWCSSDCYCSFRSLKWWDFDQNRGYAWMINFSTEGITSPLSMQISVLNSSQRFYSPRYWKAEWSEVDSMDPVTDEQWHLIGEYTVPDISQWTGTLFSSVVGYKAINFDLPEELLGKKNVYVRLMPYSNECSSGGDYTDAIITNDEDGDKHASSIDYIAIRYNK